MKSLLFVSLYIITLFTSCNEEFKSPIQILLQEGSYKKIVSFEKQFNINNKCVYPNSPPPFGTQHIEYEVVENVWIRKFSLENCQESDSVHTILVKIIENKDSIIYYSLIEKFNSLTSTYEIKDSFIDNLKLNSIKAKFAADFSGIFNVQELFRTEDYSFYCGDVDPLPTSIGIYTNSLIKIKDKGAIMDLVSASDPGKMLFGLYAINKLCLKGILLDNIEKEIIKNALKKKGKVPCCACYKGGEANIQDEMKEFKCLLNYK